MDLNCAGPLVHGFFSINTTVVHDLWLAEPKMWNSRYGGLTTDLNMTMGIFTDVAFPGPQIPRHDYYNHSITYIQHVL